VTGQLERVFSSRMRGPHADRLAEWAGRSAFAGLQIADVILVSMMAGLAVWEGSMGLGIHPLLPATVFALEVGLLLFRRRAPFLVFLAMAVLLFAGGILSQILNIDLPLGNSTGDLCLWIAVYTVAALRGPRWAALAILSEFIVYIPAGWLNNGCDVFCDIGWSALFVFAAIAGYGMRQGRRLHEDLSAQTDLLRRTREERVRLAVTEERTRVARDLHDVVAHGLTVMVVQAGAARALAVGNPSRAREALTAVDRAGVDALGELSLLMSSLGSDPPDADPSHSNDEGPSVRSLVAHAKAAGVQVELSIEGEPDDLDPALEISVYRIVQEAMTNVSKHAPGARTWIRIRYSAQAVEIEVTNSGAPAGPEPAHEAVPGAGQGLIGIAERAALFGGEIDAGPTGQGGFRLRTSLRRDAMNPVTA
jgi:signal transduction histidine kinase